MGSVYSHARITHNGDDDDDDDDKKKKNRMNAKATIPNEKIAEPKTHI